MKQNTLQAGLRDALVLAIIGIGILTAGAAWGVTLTNSAGATVDSLSTEADSGLVLANSAGAQLEVLTTDQASADTSDGAGAWSYLGLLDPALSTTAARYWALYD